MEKKNFEGRDLLSLLIRANMATDLPDNARMTDEEVLARESDSKYCDSNRDVDLPMLYEEVPTFLLAGHETTRFLLFVV